MAVMVPRERVIEAVSALQKWKEVQSVAQKPQLLPEDDFIYLNLTLKKIPPKSRTNPFRIPLPNPLFDPNSELCLIIDDRPKSNLTSETAKKIIKSHDIPISKVLKLSKLKSNYKPFEAKRKLCDSYDLFLVDRRIVHLLPKLLGKFFFKKKKLPLPLDLSHRNWKEQIERALGCGFLYMRTGTCCVMKVGKVSMEREEMVENIMEGINGVVEVVPKKWGGVRSLHLKFSDSLALPVYQALPDVKLKIDGVVKESEEVSDAEVEVKMKEESSGGEGKMGKKKKKGRIHEVRYMDVGVGVDELESEDDEVVDNEGKKSEDDEFVGSGVEGKLDSDDEGEGTERQKSKDEDDEDFDSDDFGVKKGKKGKTVKGLGKKVGKVEKSREKDAKKSRLSLEVAKKSSEKKEKKKSQLGARLKEGSITKKANRSKSKV